MFEKLLKILSGDDIFISYSRRDGAGYAANLAKKLVDLRFSVYFDQWTTPPGKDLPASLRRKLRRCSVLVVLGTPGAARSDHVRQEIAEFNTTGRTVIPIIFDSVRASDLVSRDGALVPADETIADAVWAPLIQGLALQPETCANLINNEAPEGVIGRITDTCRFVRKTRRQLLTGAAVLAISTIVSVSAGVYASAKSREAVAAINEADRQTVLAGEARSSAEAERSRADQLRKQAEDLSKEVADKTKLAEAAGKRADEQTRIASAAETRAKEARIRADQQTARARTSLAENYFTQAQLATDPRRALVWAGNAVETAPQEDAKRSIYQLATTHLASKMPMTLINTPGPIQTAYFNDTGDKAAVLAKNGELALWDLKTGSQIGRPLAAGVPTTPAGDVGPVKNILLVFSRDGNWIAALLPDVAATKKTIGRGEKQYRLQIWNGTTAALLHDIPVSYQPPDESLDLAFSPTGNEVVVFGWFEFTEGVRVWDRAAGSIAKFVEPVIRSQSWSSLDTPGAYKSRVPLSREPSRNWFLNITKGTDWNDVLEIRRIGDGGLIKKIPTQESIIFADFSPDAKTVITVSKSADKKELRSWDIDSGSPTPIERPAGYDGGCVYDSDRADVLGISREGHDLLIGRQGVCLEVWHRRDDGTRITYLDPDVQNDDPKLSVTSQYFFSQDGRFIVEDSIHYSAATISGGGVRVWDATTGHMIAPRTTLPGETVSSAVSPTNMIVGVSSVDGSLMTWNLVVDQTTAEKKQLVPDRNHKHKIYLTPKGDEVLVIWYNEKGKPAKMQLFDIRSGSPKWREDVSVSFDAVQSGLIFSLDGSRFLLTSVREDESSPAWNMYRTSDGQLVPEFRAVSDSFIHGGSPDLRFNRDGTMLVGVDYDPVSGPRIWKWTAASGEQISMKPLELPEGFDFLQFTSTGDYYVAASRGQRSFVVQSTDPRPSATFEIRFGDEAMRALGIALLSRARDVRIAGAMQLTLDGGATISIKKHELGDQILVDSFGVQVQFPPTREATGMSLKFPDSVFSQGAIKIYDISADGSLIAVGTGFQDVKICDTRTGRALSDALWHEAGPNLVKFIGTAQLLTIDEEGQKRLWNIEQPKRETSSWIAGLGEALSGIRLVDQTTLQLIPQNASVREKYIEKLRRAQQSDAAARAILKNLGLSSAP